MEEWKEYKLKDICDYGKGRTEVSSLDNSTYISTENMLPNRAGVTTATTLPTGEYTQSFEIDDTLVSNIRPYFKKIWKASFSGGCSADILVFKAKENISKDYLYYVLADDEFFKYSMATSKGTKMPRGDKVSIMEYPIKLPPLPTQQKIAAILSSLDDKIELNNKINTNLEQQAQALFKNWFVDFEPFGGKMPEGWKECKAEEYFEITIGKTPPRKEQEWFSEEKTDQTIKWVSISDMGSCGTFISDSSEYLTTDAVSKFNVKVVPANTVLLSFKLTVGRIAITDDEMCTNEAIAHFGTKDKAINEYLYLYLKNFNYQTMGSTSSIATAVNSKIIKAMLFILPDEKTINNFHQTTNSLFEKIREHQHENRTLSTIRDTLLPKLMNGEIIKD